MNRKSDKSLIVGLDIGTSKVTALVGEYAPDQPIEVIGIGSHESRGMRRGVVVDIESTVQSIQRAIEEADVMAGCEIRSVYASIAGSHIQCRNSNGVVPIASGEVSYADLDRVLEAARAVAVPADQRILHAIPQEYIVDGSQEGIRNPVGMSGVRLEVRAHLVTGATAAAANISKCIQRCGLSVDDLILSQLASSTAVLTADEKELGVVLVDIGAGTTDIAVFVGGAIRHSACLPIAGDQITNDIAMALRTPTKDAEEIKVGFGVAKQLLADPGEQLEVPGLGDRAPRMLSRQALAGVIEPRVEEIFSLVRARRGHVPQAGPARQPDLRRSAVRHGGQHAQRHRDGAARGGAAGACARPEGGGAGRLGEDRDRPRQGMVPGEFLKRPRRAPRQGPVFTTATATRRRRLTCPSR